LEARLDRKRLPKPSADWAQAHGSLHEYMARAQEEMEEALRAIELEDQAGDYPGR
jgi:hypothetical protein